MNQTAALDNGTGHLFLLQCPRYHRMAPCAFEGRRESTRNASQGPRSCRAGEGGSDGT